MVCHALYGGLRVEFSVTSLAGIGFIRVQTSLLGSRVLHGGIVVSVSRYRAPGGYGSSLPDLQCMGGVERF